MKSPTFLASCLASLAPIVPLGALADNPNFAPGDLVLFFQQEGGSKTVYASLGNAATEFRGSASGPGASNKISFRNVNAALTSAFGAGWASDTTLYAGLAGVWGTNSTNTSLQDGDPHRTLYVSAPRQSAGTEGQADSAGYTGLGNSFMTIAAGDIFTMNARLDNYYASAVQVVNVSNSSETQIDGSLIPTYNPIPFAGVQGTAFETFEGGVQQVGSAGSWGTMGAAGSVEFALDLYRILGKNNVAGQVGGPLREGTYEGTVTVDSSGNVSFISQGSGATSAFSTWVDSFNPPLTNASDREPGADPDGDGIANLMEFVLNGNPSVSNPSIAPTLDASGSDFVFTFNRRDDSESPETTLVFQYSTDLVNWTDVTVGATSSGVVGVSENGAAADQITVTISKGANTKLFGRLKASN